MSKAVIIKSGANAKVVLNVPYLNLRRRWPQKGAIQKIPFELLEQAIYEPGVEYLFKTGILYIEDDKTNIALGLKDEDGESNLIILDNKLTEELLKKSNFNKFKETVEKLSYDQIVELAHSAVDFEITDYEKNQLLQEKTGLNVYRSVMERKEEKKAAAKK